MKLKDLTRKQVFTLAVAALLILVLVAVPPLLQYFYGFSAIKAAFVIIVIYAAINWWMKRG